MTCRDCKRVYVRDTNDGSGRGVYASCNMRKGTLIEVAPVLVIPDYLVKSILENYVYQWDNGKSAIAFGVGSLFNHSFEPNCDYVYDEAGESIEYYLTRSVVKHEQITINYGYDENVGGRSNAWYRELCKSRQG